MKKNLLYLFTLLFSLSLFVACSSDDDPVDDDWKDISDTYKGDDSTLTLKMNGADYSYIYGKSVEVNTTSAEAATIVLYNVVPDDNSLTISDAVLAKSDDGIYSLTAEATVNDARLIISGSFGKNKKHLSLEVTRRTISLLAGNWTLPFYYTAETATVPVHWVATTGDPDTDALLKLFGPILSQLISAKVEEVNVFLKEDGFFDVNWKSRGAGNYTGIPSEVTTLIGGVFYAFRIEPLNQLYIALDNNILSMLEKLDLGEILPVDMKEILSLFTTLGGFSGIPVSHKEADGLTTFYIEKDLITKLLPVLEPVITKEVSEEIRPMVEQLLEALAQAEVIELGLSFEKQQ